MVSQPDDRLALVVEDAIEPELPICDPHHHFWDRDAHRGGDSGTSLMSLPRT